MLLSITIPIKEAKQPEETLEITHPPMNMGLVFDINRMSVFRALKLSVYQDRARGNPLPEIGRQGARDLLRQLLAPALH